MNRLIKYREQTYCFGNFKKRTLQKENIIYLGGGGEVGTGGSGGSGGGEGGGGK